MPIQPLGANKITAGARYQPMKYFHHQDEENYFAPFLLFGSGNIFGCESPKGLSADSLPLIRDCAVWSRKRHGKKSLGCLLQELSLGSRLPMLRKTAKIRAITHLANYAMLRREGKFLPHPSW